VVKVDNSAHCSQICGIIIEMEIMDGLRGHITLAALGVVALSVLSVLPQADPSVYQQLAASAAPSAADQIWEIGNQPVPYMQDGQSQAQVQSNGEMLGPSSPSFQNINFVSPDLNTPETGQGGVWGQLNTEVQSSEQQVANNPIPQVESTFSSGPTPLSNFEMYDSFNQPAEQTSWWTSTEDSVGSWGSSMYNNAQNFLFGSPNNTVDTPVDSIGIRG
jgi:hypothetical protein